MLSYILGLFFLMTDVQLQATVRVNPKNPSSGTVIKVLDGDAYVLSTGHMKTREGVKVQFFYMDGKKLEEPLTLDGEIVLLVENNVNGVDFSLIKIAVGKKRPAVVPFAPNWVKPKRGKKLRAIGCKMGANPSEYHVIYFDEQKGSMVTSKEEPMPGCSGGGLFMDGKLVGVCWGSYHGDELKGLFTPHTTMIQCIKDSGLGFLVEETE